MKLLRTLLIATLLNILPNITVAQNEKTTRMVDKITQSVEHPWEKYYNDLSTMEDDESTLSQSTYDELCDLEDHPININTATREDLERLPFLNDKQIEEICEYLYKYRGMKSLGELQMIESLDYYRRHILQCFIYIGDDGKGKYPSLRNILKYGKSNLLVSAKIPFYQRKGDDNGYMGYKYKHSLRYSFNYGDRLKIGLVGAQDAGEPFFSNKNNLGYDHYSYYLLMHNIGKLKTLALGCYNISFGMGLVANGSFSMGKIMTLSTLGRSSNTIRANTSRADGYYMQGAAATVEIVKGLSFSAFTSYRKMDGTMQKDSTISTIITNGYHRTQTELNKKHNLIATVFGGNIHFASNGLHIGGTILYTALDKKLNPNTTVIYRQYYAQGKEFFNGSIDYGYICHRFSFNGETAVNGKGATATINAFSYSVDDHIDVMALQRFYSKKYTALYANSFSENGNVQNENGMYIGINWHPNWNLNISAYSDYAYFVWPKYQVSNSSHTFDNMLSATYHTDKWSILARYRIKIRQKDNADKTELINQTQQRIRLSAGYSPCKKLNMQMQADMIFSQYKKDEKGWMINGNADYSIKDWLKINANFGYFNTDGYDSRIYTYEKGLLYDFSFPMFYGKGIRYALMAKASVYKEIMFIAKIGTTDYFDRTSIGSSYQKINQSAITDMEVQLRWKF